MNKELTKEETEEFYNKLWLENKELIQENMGKINIERFELELELVDKNKEIERLNNKLELISKIVEREFPPNEFITYKIKKILKGADKE